MLVYRVCIGDDDGLGMMMMRKKVVHIYILQYTLRVEFPIDHRQGVLDEYG